jgi:hypothetical protein
MNKQMNTDFAAAGRACPASMLSQETSSFTTAPRRADHSVMKILTHRMKSNSNAMAENFSRYFALSSPLLGVLVGLLAAFILNH